MNTTTNEILYTDGRDIVVTPTTFQVKGTHYRLLGITKHGLSVMRAVRLPGVIIMILGIILAGAGFSNLFPAQQIAVNGELVTANKLFLWIGIGLLAFGVFLIVIVKDRYAVRIATAEGEKNAVVSKKREYIAQIINALNRAFMLVDEKNSHLTKTTFL